MIFAILQPGALAGLLVAFLTGLAVRALVQVLFTQRLLRYRVGSPLPHPRRDVDPFGAIAAALGGTGWGRAAPLPEAGWLTDKPGRRVAVLLAGPAAVVVAGMLLLVGFRLGFPDGLLQWVRPSDVLRGAAGPVPEQFLASWGVGMLCFGMLALVPLPPLDGWWLLWLALRRPGETAQKVRFWLQERNIGVLLLFLGIVLPIGTPLPLLLMLLDLLVSPLIRLVAG